MQRIQFHPTKEIIWKVDGELLNAFKYARNGQLFCRNDKCGILGIYPNGMGQENEGNVIIFLELYDSVLLLSDVKMRTEFLCKSMNQSILAGFNGKAIYSLEKPRGHVHNFMNSDKLDCLTEVTFSCNFTIITVQMENTNNEIASLQSQLNKIKNELDCGIGNDTDNARQSDHDQIEKMFANMNQRTNSMASKMEQMSYKSSNEIISLQQQLHIAIRETENKSYNEMLSIKRRLNNSVTEMRSMKKTIMELQNRLASDDVHINNDQNTNEKEEDETIPNYTLCVQQLVKLAREPSPKYELQSKCPELKEIVLEKYCNDGIRIKSDEHRKYKKAIEHYINKNKNKKFNPIIAVSRNTSYKQRQLLSKFKITNNQRVPALNGQFGLKLTKDINSGVVLGEYYGKECLEQEFDCIYNGCKEQFEKNKYAFSEVISVELTNDEREYFMFVSKKRKFDSDCNNNDNNCNHPSLKKRKLNNGISQNVVSDLNCDDETEHESYFTLVIDAIDTSSPSLLIYMNDCRKNYKERTLSNDDLTYVSASHVSCQGFL